MSTHKPPYFADDRHATEWDHETGKPGVILFANSLTTWAAMQDREMITVAEAAEAFNVPAEMITTAVRADYYMFLLGDPRDPAHCAIELDGD